MQAAPRPASRPEGGTISVFAYSDYRAFLRDYQQQARTRNPRFSHRHIANRLGYASSGWFGDLLKGRVRLGSGSLVRLVALLGLGAREADYFEALVNFTQADAIEEKNRAFRKMMSFKEVRVDVVGLAKFEYFSHWYYSAIRELLFFHDFRGDYEALSRTLRPAIKTTQAREAVEVLRKLGFLRKDAQGRLRPAPATLQKDPAFKSIYAMNYLKANMELAMLSLEEIPKDERHVSAMTLSFSRSGFETALAEVETFRKRMLSLMEEDRNPSEVYQLNLQLFPVTHRGRT